MTTTEELFDVDIGEQPTRKKVNGNISYNLSNGKFHRLDGPAYKTREGTKYWFQHSKLHRLKDPAIEYAGGQRSWYYKNIQHRLDGPAVEGGSDREFVIDGMDYDEKDYPEAVRQYLINFLHLSYDLPFYALSDYLDDLYESDPVFKFEGRTYHELADMIRQNYQ